MLDQIKLLFKQHLALSAPEDSSEKSCNLQPLSYSWK